MSTQVSDKVKPFVKQVFVEGAKVTVNSAPFTVVKDADGEWNLLGSHGSLYMLRSEVAGTDSSIRRIFSKNNGAELRGKDGKPSRVLILGVEMMEVA